MRNHSYTISVIIMVKMQDKRCCQQEAGEGKSREVKERNQTKSELASLRNEMLARFEAVDYKFDAVDRRFDAVDSRFDSLEARIPVMEKMAEFEVRIAEIEILWLIKGAKQTQHLFILRNQ